MRVRARSVHDLHTSMHRSWLASAGTVHAGPPWLPIQRSTPVVQRTAAQIQLVRLHRSFTRISRLIGAFGSLRTLCCTASAYRCVAGSGSASRSASWRAGGRSLGRARGSGDAEHFHCTVLVFAGVFGHHRRPPAPHLRRMTAVQ